jgi:transposase InsO family protein
MNNYDKKRISSIAILDIEPPEFKLPITEVNVNDKEIPGNDLSDIAEVPVMATAFSENNEMSLYFRETKKQINTKETKMGNIRTVKRQMKKKQDVKFAEDEKDKKKKDGKDILDEKDLNDEEIESVEKDEDAIKMGEEDYEEEDETEEDFGDDEESEDSDDDDSQEDAPAKTPYRDALLSRPKAKSININEAHRKFGRCSLTEMKSLAKVLNFKLTGTLAPCPACLMAKSHQSRTRKQTINSKPSPGELLGIDLTGPFPPDIHQTRYMAVACDDATCHSWSKAIKTKTELKEFASDLLQELQRKDIKVKRVRCDNAPENKKYLSPICQQHGIALELTAPHTPQFNGKVERCIAELWKNTKAVLTAARLTQQYKSDLWSYAWKYVENTRSPMRTGSIFTGEDRQRRILSQPIEFGRIGVVDTGKKTKKSMNKQLNEKKM